MFPYASARTRPYHSFDAERFGQTDSLQLFFVKGPFDRVAVKIFDDVNDGTFAPPDVADFERFDAPVRRVPSFEGESARAKFNVIPRRQFGRRGDGEFGFSVKRLPYVFQVRRTHGPRRHAP